MSEVSASYRDTAEQVAFNVANKVLPMAQLPESLAEAYQGLFNELLEDRAMAFGKAWDALPASARGLMEKAAFHGFYIANAWLQLSRVAQEIADQAETEEAMDEKEYNGVFGRLAEQSLKESLRKLKKARTDRSMLNSFKQVMAP
ncbi:DUF3069 domain-containing protein [Shewanella salipaludis]|uniref:DUF3069 domain-containing protein n=1 Tax=Shewanella salipaludis TaxID=2723052 RepID=A0A972G083_9GAMM|nr:DUF3069 domain-containing protein [Shewanella salipaludis]NMH66418.1 DUF3069 domain-containing protein [Shewanella salipaludis]